MKCPNPALLAIYFFFFRIAGPQAQMNIDVARASWELPVIDGIEEEVWDAVDPVNFNLMLGTEVATVTAYWKALHDNKYIYVLISVEDDDHYPAWESGGNVWEYDKPEIYFDVNDDLVDGAGPSLAGSGHYQFSPGFDLNGYGELHEAEGTTQSPGGLYAYVLTGESYLYESAIDMCSMNKKDGTAMSCWNLIGFDATIIDQDKDITTSRQRTVWQCGDGPEGEAWNNMDASGTITLIGSCYYSCGNGINDARIINIAVHPNPVKDFLTLGADYDRVVIVNMLGQEISTLGRDKTDRLNVGYLSKGVYVIKVFKGETYIGAAMMAKD